MDPQKPNFILDLNEFIQNTTSREAHASVQEKIHHQ